jgi:periplasmic divalent cation tolerance protein
MKKVRLLRKPKLQVVVVTAPVKEAELIARMLLEERLIACANLVPGVQSMYWWEQSIEKANETLLLLKLPSSNRDALFRRLQELHSYSVPEFLVVPITDASEDYVKWATAEAQPSKAKTLNARRKKKK